MTRRSELINIGIGMRKSSMSLRIFSTTLAYDQRWPLFDRPSVFQLLYCSVKFNRNRKFIPSRCVAAWTSTGIISRSFETPNFYRNSKTTALTRNWLSKNWTHCNKFLSGDALFFSLTANGN